MGIWTLLEYAAWAASAALLLWMVLDAARVGRDYDEDVLLSSREGEIELSTEELARPEGR
jgi:hypothetical protein